VREKKMRLYTRFVRAKKGMSTIFGALFFVILILMGFNLMLWNFAQFDAYNRVVTTMGLRDQQRSAEVLTFNPPGITNTGSPFNFTVNNIGGVTATITRIYIQNLAPLNGGSPCQGSLCIADPTGSPTFNNPNIKTGESFHIVTVTGIAIDNSGYRIVVATTRGNEFSFYFPWPSNLGGGSNSNSTNTAHGALDVKFDLNSFNFTRGSQTVPVPGWTVPYNTPLVYWVKVVNNAISPITLSQYTSLYFVCYQDRFGAGSQYTLCPETDLSYVVDSGTMNPNSLLPYDEVNNPYVIPAATPSGPNGFKVVKFGSICPAQQCGTPIPNQDVDYPTAYLVFMGFFYRINGQIVGQTISFVAVRACSTYPSCP
jgi:hypothetical protein